MSRVPLPEGEAVMVSWVSVGAGPAPLMSALDRPSPLAGKVSHLYLCWRDAPGGVELEAVRATERAIKELTPTNPTVKRMRWKTTAQPTDHAAIRPFAERTLKRVRKDHPNAHVFIHLSPGTPAMHAVWLVLGSTGLIAGPLTMLQGVPAHKRGAGAPIQAVPLEVDSWLQRFRRAKPKTQGDVDDGQLWDPGDFAIGSPMRVLLGRLQDWAHLRAPVLLLGERGTGKSTLANYLRAIGPFQRGTPQGDAVQEWPAVVCGQFVGDVQMARSELFGHAKGAFTGAIRDRVGLIEHADGECLFLDEIADLDRDTQRLLMAALEGRGFQRLGDVKRRYSSFRLICATNRPLADLAGGTLDDDFYDRVSVFTVRVPALREVRDDLPVFWRGVLKRVGAASGLHTPFLREFADDELILAALRKHPLAGNLRDLQRVAWHLIARLHRGDDGETAAAQAISALPEPRLDGPDLPPVDALRSLLPLDAPLPGRLDELRGRWVQAALDESGGNKSAAANLLGVKRETFKGWVSS